ncbi:MAG: carboxylating nicotinate-nucleotide diphosphorylase [Actinomycetes bacterium]
MEYTELIKKAIAEDLGGGEDVTSLATVDESERATAEFRSRKNGVVAGVNVAKETLEILGITDVEILISDGQKVRAGEVLLRARGNTRSLLLAERTALNFLGHLSGIATLTHLWVDAVAGSTTQIRDTRKTTPGLRELEKYAVRMGGGVNHRLTLGESALIKDNHIEAAGGVAAAFFRVRSMYPTLEVEVEVDTLDQLREIVPLAPDLILLDNMSVKDCASAVSIVNGAIKLEASGGLTLENAKSYASTGVDYLAVGALTHSAPVLDIGLDLKAEI